MVKEGSLTGHTADDFSEASGLGEVAKEHGDKLIPAANTTGMSFSSMLLDSLLKFISRKQTEHLTKNTMQSYHVLNLPFFKVIE